MTNQDEIRELLVSGGYRLDNSVGTDRTVEALYTYCKQQVAEAGRKVGRLQDDIAKYGDGEPVRHLGEAVVPISKVLALAAELTNQDKEL
jgi:hypothetical protein